MRYRKGTFSMSLLRCTIQISASYREIRSVMFRDYRSSDNRSPKKVTVTVLGQPGRLHQRIFPSTVTYLKPSFVLHIGSLPPRSPSISPHASCNPPASLGYPFSFTPSFQSCPRHRRMGGFLLGRNTAISMARSSVPE